MLTDTGVQENSADVAGPSDVNLCFIDGQSLSICFLALFGPGKFFVFYPTGGIMAPCFLSLCNSPGAETF